MKLEQAMVFWNPWWTDADCVMDAVPRAVLSDLKAILNRKEILCISGVRRSGKTTIMRLLIRGLLDGGVPAKNLLHLNLEDPIFRGLTIQELFDKYIEMMNPTGKCRLFLDEVQECPGWQMDLRKLYDGFNPPGIALTGSNAALLKGEYATLLTGRTLISEVYPFDFREFVTTREHYLDFEKPSLLSRRPRMLSLFREYMRYGGFPEVVLTDDTKIKNLLLKEYYTAILTRDVLRRYAIRQPAKCESLAHYLISNIAGSLSVKNLAAVLATSMNTVEEYLGHLQESYLFSTVNHFSYSVKRQITYPRKVYSIDNGFINAVSFKFSEDTGRNLENLVFSDLMRRGHTCYYYKGRKECDFIIQDDSGRLQAIQVSVSLNDPKTKKREIEGLLEAMKAVDLKRGLILTFDEFDDLTLQDRSVSVVPAWYWMLTGSP